MSTRKQPLKGASAPKKGAVSRRQRRSKAARANPSYSMQKAPITTGATVLSPLRIEFGRAPYSSNADAEGLRLSFRTPVAILVSPGSADGTFGALQALSGTPTTVPVPYMMISPSVSTGVTTPGFPQSITNIAQSFQQYRFRKLDFEYVTECPTTDAGCFAMAYVRDPEDGSYNFTSGTTIGEATQYPRSIQFPVWATTPVKLTAINDERVDDKDAPLFYCVAPALPSKSDDRWAYQGLLGCVTDTQSTTTSNSILGRLYACGIVDLYGLSVGGDAAPGHARLRGRQICQLVGPRLSTTDRQKYVVLTRTEEKEERKEMVRTDFDDVELVDYQPTPSKGSGPLGTKLSSAKPVSLRQA